MHGEIKYLLDNDIIYREGMESSELTEVLQDCKVLQSLELSLQHELLDHPSWLSVLRKLSKCPRLRILKLNWVDKARSQDEEEVDEFALALGSVFESPSLESFTFRFPFHFTNKERFAQVLFSPLAASPCIAELRLSHFSFMNNLTLNPLLEALGRNTSLLRLDLSETIAPQLVNDLRGLVDCLARKNSTITHVLLPRSNAMGAHNNRRVLRLLTGLNASGFRCHGLPAGKPGIWPAILSSLSDYPCCVHAIIQGSRQFIGS